MITKRGIHRLRVFLVLVAFACIAELYFARGIILHRTKIPLEFAHEGVTTASMSNESTALSNFPKAIYQTASHIQPDTAKSFTESWRRMNPHYRYEILTDDSALTFVSGLYATSRPELVQVFRELHQKVIVADLLRYILMFELGGIYTDIDTKCLRSIDEWNIPNNTSINLVIGLETNELEPDTFNDDRVADFGFLYRLQFLQWTLMAKPGHMTMKVAIDQVVSGVLDKARLLQKPIKSIRFTPTEVLSLSGPGLYTRVVKAYIAEKLQRQVLDSEMASTSFDQVITDVMILPVNAWAPAQRHSQAGSVDTALVYHAFAGTWKTPWWKDYFF